MLALGFVLLAAMLTYREHLPPGEEPALANVCGSIGAFLAGTLLHKFGLVAYLFALAIAVEGLRLFRSERERSMVQRLPGLLLFAIVLAAVLSDCFAGATRTIPDPGGEVGLALSRLLVHQSGFGALGGRVVLLFLLLTTFVIASGLLYSQGLEAAAQWAGERKGRPRRASTRAAKSGAAAVPAIESDDEVDEEAGDEDWAENEWDEGEWEDGEEGWDEEDWDEEDGEAELSADGDDEEEWEDEEEEDDDAAWTRWEDEEEDEYDEESEEPDDTEGEVESVSVAGDEDAPWDEDEDSDEEPSDSPVAVAPAAERADEVEEDEAGESPAVEQWPEDADGVVEDEEPSAETSLADLPEPVDGNAAADAEPTPYVFPTLDLLRRAERDDSADTERTTHEVARKLVEVLASFRVEARVVGIQRGPTIKMYEVELAPGTKLGRLRSLEDDLAMNLAAQSVRIVAPIPNKSTAGIEIPNEERDSVVLRGLIEAPRWRDAKLAIPFFLGKGTSGRPIVADLAAMPHLLVAGSTGAGKSVCLNTMIMSVLYTRTPQQVQMILIDPKMVELSQFQNIPHLMCPVVTDMKRAAGILEWAVEKMEARYQLLHQAGVRNIHAYNRLGPEKLQERLGDEYGDHVEGHLPFIVIVIDELADLMMVAAKDIESSITRLAQKSRAVGIHVILATQRPSTNVITGLIKANLPTRIAFRVASKIDSRVILDANGAEKLLGAGDMLYLPPKSADLVRVQGTFVDDDEIVEVVAAASRSCKPVYSRELIQKRAKNDQDPSEIDELYDEAAGFVLETQRGSASLLQRRYQIGYTRASRLIDLMAGDGLLGDYRGSQAREVLMTKEEFEAQRKEALARNSSRAKSAGGRRGAGADMEEATE